MIFCAAESKVKLSQAQAIEKMSSANYKIRVAINGFGRIGRQAFKAALEREEEIEIVAINDLASVENLAYLLKYDTNYGVYPRDVGVKEGKLRVDEQLFPVLAEKEPAQLPWREYEVDVVIESTGFFTEAEAAAQHLRAGAKRVIISAPSPDEQVVTVLRGINEQKLAQAKVVSNASCTTNSAGPVMAVLHEAFGVEQALLSTVHGYTSTQNLVDGPSRSQKDLRRGRAAAENIVPSSTGAAKATTRALPELSGKFDGVALRVPVATVSIADITAVVRKPTMAEEVNAAFEQAAKQPQWKGILAVTREPLVSADIKGRPESAIVDLAFTRVVGGTLVKVLAWYDNEWGYAQRLVEVVIAAGRLARA